MEIFLINTNRERYSRWLRLSDTSYSAEGSNVPKIANSNSLILW